MPTTSEEDKPDSNDIQGFHQLQWDYRNRLELMVVITMRLLQRPEKTPINVSVKRLTNGIQRCQFPSLYQRHRVAAAGSALSVGIVPASSGRSRPSVPQPLDARLSRTSAGLAV